MGESPPAKKLKLDHDADDTPVAAKYQSLLDRGTQRPSEATVGITQYVDPSVPAFTAIIKHRLALRSFTRENRA